MTRAHKFASVLAAGTLLAAFSAHRAVPAQAPAPSQALPGAQQVLDRFVQAQGGHDAIFRHHFMTVRGKLEIQPQNLSFSQVNYYKDGKAVTVTTYPDGSVDRTGFDGTMAWEVDQKGLPAIADSKILESIRRDADMHYFGHIMDYFDSLDVIEIGPFAGHTCYHLKGTNKWGIRNEHYYDTTTGLLVGYRFDSSWRGGPGEEHEVFSGYKEFDGWLIPTVDVQSNAKGSVTTTTASVTFDDIPDAVFAIPDAIKALKAGKASE